MAAQSRKQIFEEIRQKIAAGASRAETFQQYSTVQTPKSVAMVIGGIPTPSRRAEYRRLNHLLAGLILFSGVTRAASFFYALSDSTFSLIGLAAILLPALFAYEIIRCRGYVYRTLGFLAFAGVLRGLSELGRYEIEPVFLGFLIGNSVLLIATGLLSFFLAKKMFPDLKLMDARKNSATGQYEFTE